MTKLNFKKLRIDMQRVSNELRFFRSNGYTPAQLRLRELLATWPPIGDPRRAIWNKEYAELCHHSREALREKMTILCSIRAHHHGRLHRKKVRNPYANQEGQPKFWEISVEDQVKLIEKHLKDYEQEVSTTPVAEGR